MKVMTILGTRPEIIRLSQIIPKLDTVCDHVLVHTGQNYDPTLSDVFFDELGVRPPDHYLGVQAESFGKQVGKILSESEKVLSKEQPNRLLVLGDTNSGLSAIIAKRIRIPVYHMEAGNRCYDDRVPEEINRRIIDHCSDVLMPYTNRSRANLLREGIDGPRIHVTGNPIHEVIDHYEPQIAASKILKKLKLQPNRFFLVTMHRAENVDVEKRLMALTQALRKLHEAFDLPVIISTHPHTKARMETFDIEMDNDAIRFLPPFGFFDFVMLERSAYCVLSDSGTVQEECCILKIANVTIRDVTERPETIECGSNILSGVEPESVLRCVRTVLDRDRNWTPPPEYLVEDVSSTVIKIVMGYEHSL
jgi:UDP-N-acetylglucosamine 2-epimerase (non-hydrolysing)